MSDHLRKNVWLIGSGSMAQAYAAVLRALDLEPLVIGRGEASATAFEKATRIPVIRGGLDRWLLTKPEPPAFVIIAVSVMQLATVAHAIASFYREAKILMEKPGFISQAHVSHFDASALDRLYVAYNRRYFSSSLYVLNELAVDGGATSGFFEFTEWEHRITALLDQKDPEELNYWLISNSSHVIDLAFHFLGKPSVLDSTTQGSIAWHPSASSFCGSGRTEAGCLFSYRADWTSPGRWWLDVSSQQRRFRMCPLEQVEVQAKGELNWKSVELDDQLDKTFKPGLFRMVDDFISGQPSLNLCTARHQIEMLRCYRKIANYPAL